MSDPGVEGGGPARSVYGVVTEGMVRQLRETVPWVQFIAIMGFVGAGLVVLMALFLVVSVGTMDQDVDMGSAVAVALLYLLLALIYVVVSSYLYRFAGGIRSFDRNHDAGVLEQAFEYQKKFWRIVGIICIIYLILGVLAVGFGLVGGRLTTTG